MPYCFNDDKSKLDFKTIYITTDTNVEAHDWVTKEILATNIGIDDISKYAIISVNTAVHAQGHIPDEHGVWTYGYDHRPAINDASALCFINGLTNRLYVRFINDGDEDTSITARIILLPLV